MKEADVKNLARQGLFEGKPMHGTIEETHISWVVLTQSKAFKIKKPVKLPFLDFSTLRLRKEFCKRELKLNKRFSKIYEAVLPITKAGHHFQMGGKGKPIDYAVMMKRMDQAKRMDKLLRLSVVGKKQIERLANIIARFHLASSGMGAKFDMAIAQSTFNDISTVRNVVENNLGRSYGRLITASEEWSDAFLKLHQTRFQTRISRGFMRDVHGDLHSGNIFLYREPVLFDCIEFNDQYRQIDVLYEIAFLCMDLEFFGKSALSAYLLKQYLKRFPCIESPEDKKIFTYYKCLRANVRAKVFALHLRQTRSPVERQQQKTVLKKYLELIRTYIQQKRIISGEAH